MNKNIQQPTLIYRWMTSNYAARVSVGIRRLTDRDTRAVSLYRLIQDISANRQAITRDYFVSKYPRDMREEGLADDDFDRFASKRDNEVSEFKLKRDLRRLQGDTTRIRLFVDKWVAHCDADQKRYVVPNYGDVARALQDIDRVYCKYVLLTSQGSMTTCKPEIQYDWREPLRHPWIEMSDEVKEHRLRIGNGSSTSLRTRPSMPSPCLEARSWSTPALCPLPGTSPDWPW